VLHNDAMLRTLLDRIKSSTSVAIPDQLWTETLSSLPFLTRLDADERARLRTLAGQLLADKQMSGAADLVLTDEIQVNIAVQASLPVLNLGIDWYRGWKEIIVYPGEFLVPRNVTDDDGVVHEYVEPIVGEAWDRGPLLVSWHDAQHSATGAAAASSVVIHEFVHKLDLLDGAADGIPPFSALQKALTPERWYSGLQRAFDRFVAELEMIESQLPEGFGSDPADEDRYYAHLPFDAYAGEDEAEFFAVSSEAFFVAPRKMQQTFPEWYALLTEFFLQNPLAQRP